MTVLLITIFLLLLDGKSKRDKGLIGRNREAKVVETAFSEDVFLIIWFYWSNLCFLGTIIDVYKDNYIKKDGGNPGINIADAKKDRRADKLGTNATNADRVKNLSKNIANANNNREAENSNITTTNKDKAKNLGITKLDIDKDRKVKELGISIIDIYKAKVPSRRIANIDKVEDLGINTTEKDRANISNTRIANVNIVKDSSIANANKNNNSCTGR